jgi:hypothetical protein
MSTEPIKAKRGRKSKKELMAALNIEQISPNKKESHIDLNISEIDNTDDNLKNEVVSNIVINASNNDISTSNNEKLTEDTPVAKKRGRKPKGGKIIQHIISNEKQMEDKPNVILHLKCSMKDLQNSNQGNCLVETFNFKNDLPFDLLSNNDNMKNDNKNYNDISAIENENDNEETTYCKDVNKDIWKKLKH